MDGDIPGPDVIKIMLNSAEHETVNAHKYKNRETQLFFQITPGSNFPAYEC